MPVELKSVQLPAVGGLAVLRALVHRLHLIARLVIMRRALAVLGAVSPIYWGPSAAIAVDAMAQAAAVLFVPG